MDKINKGKKLLIAAIVIALTCSFVFTALISSSLYAAGYVNEATYKLAQGAFRFGLECLLFLFVYKGHRWARILALVLFGAGAIVTIVMVVSHMMMTIDTLYLLMISPIVIMYAFCFCVLISKPVKAYQNYKRAGRLLPDSEIKQGD